MEENMNNQSITPEENTSEANVTEAAPEQNMVMLRRRIKGGYNWAGAAILLVFGFSIVLSIIYSNIFSVIETPKIMAENPNMQLHDIIIEVQTRLMSGDNIIVYNAVLTLIADAAAFLLLFKLSKRIKFGTLFTKPQLPASSAVMLVFAILGIQGISIFVQGLVTQLTGYTGINEQLQNAMSFGSTPAVTVLFILYGVVLGPIFEELIFRGMVLGNCSCVNRTFGLVVSALLFGVFHGNFNQIFNAFLLGLVLGYAALKTRSLVVPIIMHIIANANAFGSSYIFETLMSEKKGEEFAIYAELGYFAVLAVIGIICIVMLIKKHGISVKDDVMAPEYTFDVGEEETKKLGWRTMLKSPTFWLSIAYGLINAISMVTAVAQ